MGIFNRIFGGGDSKVTDEEASTIQRSSKAETMADLGERYSELTERADRIQDASVLKDFLSQILAEDKKTIVSIRSRMEVILRKTSNQLNKNDQSIVEINQELEVNEVGIEQNEGKVREEYRSIIKGLKEMKQLILSVEVREMIRAQTLLEVYFLAKRLKEQRLRNINEISKALAQYNELKKRKKRANELAEKNKMLDIGEEIREDRMPDILKEMIEDAKAAIQSRLDEMKVAYQIMIDAEIEEGGSMEATEVMRAINNLNDLDPDNAEVERLSKLFETHHTHQEVEAKYMKAELVRNCEAEHFELNDKPAESIIRAESDIDFDGKIIKWRQLLHYLQSKEDFLRIKKKLHNPKILYITEDGQLIMADGEVNPKTLERNYNESRENGACFSFIDREGKAHEKNGLVQSLPNGAKLLWEKTMVKAGPECEEAARKLMGENIVLWTESGESDCPTAAKLARTKIEYSTDYQADDKHEFLGTMYVIRYYIDLNAIVKDMELLKYAIQIKAS